MSSKYSTKQYISAQYCAKQMSKIWCKNIQSFLRYSSFRVGIFYFASPCKFHCNQLTTVQDNQYCASIIFLDIAYVLSGTLNHTMCVCRILFNKRLKIEDMHDSVNHE